MDGGIIALGSVPRCITPCDPGIRKAFSIFELEFAKGSHTATLPMMHDIYESFIITTPLPEMIDSITISLSELTLFHISGHAIRILTKNARMYEIPIGCSLINTGGKITITIDTLCPNHFIYNKLIGEHLFGDLADIAAAYLDRYDSNLFKLYTRAGFCAPEINQSLRETPQYITQYVEQVHAIRSYESSFNAPIMVRDVSQVIFSFSTRGGPPIDILERGSFIIGGRIYSEFSSESAWRVDKFANGQAIPDDPIYTVTFGNSDSANVNLRHWNHSIVLQIAPQPIPIQLHVICVSRNIYLPAVGLRYTT